MCPALYVLLPAVCPPVSKPTRCLWVVLYQDPQLEAQVTLNAVSLCLDHFLLWHQATQQTFWMGINGK